MKRPHEVKLGHLITDGDTMRDAIHIAVAPCKNGEGEPLYPGQRVGLRPNSSDRACSSDNPIGIVDPYLDEYVKPGEWFWVLLFPQTITSLRHQWAHPAFDGGQEQDEDVRVGKKAKSLEWLKAHEETFGFKSEDLIAEVEGSDEHFSFGTTSGPDWAQTKEFWDHMENITGKAFDDEHRENTYFSCGC